MNHTDMSHYLLHTLPNGLRVVHFPTDAAISYCGVAVHAGTRDEASNESGLAHFVEHMLFKGTVRRKAWHILNRMDAVGGEASPGGWRWAPRAGLWWLGRWCVFARGFRGFRWG